jgi:hypothetical protein
MFFEWLTGRAARREEREAYLKAITVVAESAQAQTAMISQWLGLLNSQESVKGWTVTDKDQWLEEQKRNSPESFVGMPVAIADDPQAQIAWLEETVGSL